MCSEIRFCISNRTVTLPATLTIVRNSDHYSDDHLLYLDRNGALSQKKPCFDFLSGGARRAIYKLLYSCSPQSIELKFGWIIRQFHIARKRHGIHMIFERFSCSLGCDLKVHLSDVAYYLQIWRVLESQIVKISYITVGSA